MRVGQIIKKKLSGAEFRIFYPKYSINYAGVGSAVLSYVTEVM
jgi:hypothetical protein